MGILFIISVAALLALLWAAFSTARHIRRARKRQRKAIQAVEEMKRDLNATRQATKTAGPNVEVVGSESSAEANSISATRDWAEMRYSPSTFTAKHTLHRKV